MKRQILFLSHITAIIVIFTNSILVSNITALTKDGQHYQIGYAKGCQDGQDGKNPDLTKYDKVGGFSKHTIDYNTGYVDGYNTCSQSQQIDDFIE